jgi:hypothetical protein
VGFSTWGLVTSVAVLAPNLLLVRFPPRDGYASARVPMLVTWVERAGQALCVVVPAITEPGPLRWWWALPAVVGLLGYYSLWARYLATGRQSAALYGPVGGVPAPMAILPVVVFLAAGLWLSNGWVVGSAVVLAAGHIPASLMIARTRGIVSDHAE